MITLQASLIFVSRSETINQSDKQSKIIRVKQLIVILPSGGLGPFYANRSFTAKSMSFKTDYFLQAMKSEAHLIL